MFSRNPLFRSTLGVAAIILTGLALAHGVHAASPVDSSALATFAANAGFSTGPSLPVVIARLVRSIISMLGIVTVCLMLYGGFLYMTAGGDMPRVSKAKKVLTSAVIGLFVVLASFSIAQFILGRLLGAVNRADLVEYCQTHGSDPACEGYGGGGGGYGNSVASFTLRSSQTIQQCASGIRNMTLPFVFSRSVASSDGISITQNNVPVEGTFSVKGNKVMFTPSATCPEPNSAQHCFDANGTFSVEVNPLVVKSAKGDPLQCNLVNGVDPCSFTFTTGSVVDVSAPSRVTMTHPLSGAGVAQGLNQLLQASTVDDVGVASLDFFVETDDVAIQGFPLVIGEELSPESLFQTDTEYEWDPSGYLTNKRYAVWAEGMDCAGNTKTSEKVFVTVRAASCSNDQQDALAPYGETGVDCGGSTTSPYYCGACEATACTENADCASGKCENGVCKNIPVIESVSPADGAPGTLVTIAGRGFGATAGTVEFGGAEVDVGSQTVCAANPWSDRQIVVQVPEGAVDGAVRVTTATSYTDSTDDNTGPLVSPFDVNRIIRPGICAIDPLFGLSNTNFDIDGRQFGEDQGSARVFFGQYLASVSNWANEAIEGLVPSTPPGSQTVQVFTGDHICLDASGSAVSGTVCATDSDCTQAGHAKCATTWCSETRAYCQTNQSCGETGGKCVDIRRGSNKVHFTVSLATTATDRPTIASVESGWKQCVGGTKAGEFCTSDTGCGTGGTCEAHPTSGPAGQYLTVRGSQFGGATGYVQFTNKRTKDTVQGDVQFPAACEGRFWSVDTVVVKVPSKIGTEAIAAGEYDLQVVTQSGQASAATSFTIVDGRPTPGICAIEPNNGPAGTTYIQIFGENLGTDTAGQVVFNDFNKTTPGTWGNQQLSNVLVNNDVQTGPVRVEIASGISTNALNFEVGRCKADADCANGTVCCASGSCQASCSITSPTAHFAYKVSTVPIPIAPKVVEKCDETVISPSPSSLWSARTNMCLDAAVTASFTQDMDTDTFNSSTVQVERCTELVDGACKTWMPLAAASNGFSNFETGFSWTPQADTCVESVCSVTGNACEKTSDCPMANGFSAGTLHRVTLKGGEIKAVNGVALEQDYSWMFTTTDNPGMCSLSSLMVTPTTFTARDFTPVEYYAHPISQKDNCITLSCQGRSIAWSSDYAGAQVVTAEPAVGVCDGKVNPVLETSLGNPAKITAVARNTAASGTAKLTIDFADLAVTNHSPVCQEACVNALPYIQFNLPVSAANIELYKCENAYCEPDKLAQVNNVSVNLVDEGKRAELQFKPGVSLDANTWYRVKVDSDTASADWGSILAKAGSNYNQTNTTVMNPNAYFDGAYSWKFRTRSSADLCGVTQVRVSPAKSVLRFIGERQELNAVAYGSPDNCSAIGQPLQSADVVWSPWSALDTPNNVVPSTLDVAFLLENGSISRSDALPAACTSRCLLAGNSVAQGKAVCGNSIKETGESCDAGGLNGTVGSVCSSTCLLLGSTANTCGNGTVEANLGEQCDDGNKQNGDGCSGICLYEGSAGALCGDGVLDQSITGGEACDDGNRFDGDGCSSRCLLEGSASALNVELKCGNGVVEPEAGEACDDGNLIDGDGCSSRCLHTGTLPPTCGNGETDAGEDDGCDTADGIAPGCTARCLKRGSSALYATPSYCGDGTVGEGEQCEVESGAVKRVNGYAVAQISTTAPLEVLQSTDQRTASSTITAQVGAVTGTSTVQVSCSCGGDGDCGTNGGKSLACGVARCCFERPDEPVLAPVSGDGVCRNTAISVQFDQAMDLNTFGSIDESNDGKITANEYHPNVQLVLTHRDGRAVTFAASKGQIGPTDCPYYAQQTSASDTQNLFARLWNWVRGWFGGSAAYADATNQCFVPVTFIQDPVTHKVVVKYPKALVANGTYQLIVKTDGNGKDSVVSGVRSQNGVGICLGDNDGTCTGGAQKITTFTTGTDICTLDVVRVSDDGVVEPPPQPFAPSSAGYYSRSGERHAFTASALTVRKNSGLSEEIQSTDEYGWSWNWVTPVNDATSDGVEILELHGSSITAQAQFTAGTKNGVGDVIATATISVDTVSPVSSAAKTVCANDVAKNCTESTKVQACGAGVDCVNKSALSVSGSTVETVFLCENPWPSRQDGVPFQDTDANDTPTNFSMFYCRDNGKANDTTDDLPALAAPVVSTGASKTLSPDVLKEYVFRVEGTKDSIGVRVMRNPTYLSPMAWYKSKGFTGTPSATTLDGYQAVQTGTTIYVAAANKTDGIVYSNMYVISYNEDAGNIAKRIFELVLENFRLNANSDVANGGVSHVGLCKLNGAYPTRTSAQDSGPVMCASDLDCQNICQADGKCSVSGATCTPGAANQCSDDAYGYCDADKQKLARDLRRLSDAKTLMNAFESYGTTHKYCSVTTDQICQIDSQCPGSETCVRGYPTLGSGTYIPSTSISAWSSWNSVLGNTVASALPQDPLNRFGNGCTGIAGQDPASCWNGQAGTFICPAGSYVYGYQALGKNAYEIQMNLEYTGTWNQALPVDPGARGSFRFNASTTSPSSFVSGVSATKILCAPTTQNTFGTSTLCGDGVVGTGETCELGQIQSATCTLDDNKTGRKNQICSNTCNGWVDVPDSCLPLACGNGVKEGSEQCDDGVLNGTYGHCGSDCTIATAVACGDGYLAGGEQCDCGTAANFSTLTGSSNGSWAYANKAGTCTVANGVYKSNGQSCSNTCLLGAGPKCGDGVVHSGEQCDGNTEQYAGKLCSDGQTKCSVDADCSGGGTCGEANTANAACSAGQTRTRVCNAAGGSNACQWRTWGLCAGAGQVCGNGVKEGTEACDDGNSSNYDACTNNCTANVCGDGFVNVGIESCDAGANNKADSDPNKCGSQQIPYGQTCNYCTNTCQYKTQSGAYCGDGIRNGNEYCDQNDVPSTYCTKWDGDDRQKLIVGLPCARSAKNTQTGCNASAGEWCIEVGVCNGTDYGNPTGDKTCAVWQSNNTIPHNNCDGRCSNNASQLCTEDTDCGTGNTCIGGRNQCVRPICAGNCQGACPVSYQKTSVQVQSAASGAPAGSSVQLYSTTQQTQQPTSAFILLPACRLGTHLTADVSAGASIGLTNNVPFTATILAETNVNKNGTYSYVQAGTTALQIGNGLVLNLPSGFVCQSAPFKVPITLQYSSQNNAAVTVKNLEFTYCPVQ